jgi:hypothetical protein
MAGIAAEFVVDPSTIGHPNPWDGHPDGARRNVEGKGDDPSDVDRVCRYLTYIQPPIVERRLAGEILCAYRGAHAVLAPEKALILVIADAIGLAHNSGAKLSQENLLRLLRGQ